MKKKQLMKWWRIAPNGLIWSINLQNFSWRACSRTLQKELPPLAVTTVLFNHFCSWFLIFSFLKWSVQALWYRHFTCKLCVVLFRTVDIPTPLWREAGLFFLPDEYFSFATDKIWERGEGKKEIHDINQIFFITIQICLSWRVAGLLIFVSPKP